MGDIQVHLHGRNDFTLFIFNRRCSHNPGSGSSILADSDFFTAVGPAVSECFFHRAVGTLGRTPLIGIKAVITRLGVESVGKLPVVTHQFVIFILYGNDTRNGFKQSLVLISLFVQFRLLLPDLLAHLIDCRSQLAHFIELIDGDFTGIITFGNGQGVFNKLPDGTVDEL